MKTLRYSLLAALFAMAGIAQAQQAPDANKPDASAATSTGTSTSQSEMNRGVPGVDVDTGKNANGAVDVTADHNTNAANVTNDDNTSTSGTSNANMSDDNARPARADRG